MTRARMLFDIIDGGESGLAGGRGRLSGREVGLLVGALNYHSLVHPGREFKVVVLRAPDGEYPRLTDQSCHRLEWKADRTAICSLTVVSALKAGAYFDSAIMPLVIDLGGEGSEGGASFYDRAGLKGKVFKRVRFGAPIIFDAMRQGLTDVYEKRVVPRRRSQRMAAPEVSSYLSERGEQGRPPAILFGLHWLEMGGAERWALESIAVAKEAGFLPIVLTDKDSSHPWIDRPELDGALVLPMSFPLPQGEEADLLLALLREFSIRGIHVHHNNWLYHRLPWFKAFDPSIPIVDTLHILEWRTGGFVEVSVKLSNVIDIHHVISPQLRDYLALLRDVPKSRVALAPLYGLSDQFVPLAVPPANESGRPFTIAFVGRLSQQKRPYLFLRYAAELKKTVEREVKFIVHGDGALLEETQRLIRQYGLSGSVELRHPPYPVSDTLAEADLLVVSSDNEGLTLTTFEATAMNVAVLSTDVGSQASLVASQALLPRQPFAFIKEAVARTRALMSSEALRMDIVAEQQKKIMALKQFPDARGWTKGLYEGWKV
ncbi:MULTISPECIES: glycosyltransferase [unclassified Arthrobacter]|uniref:glycosyltransferase n=1 Tax=unclassified Arthrobacter TaxID=235627 RepID=UPI001C855793|nr:glycosyltransferase [Arthrobacter sp. MAHUQ-56]MBX7445430.1 glycosyltransferase [Arthrobacter sp. MAHUQ-56]